jgi:tetratricopeptide (TPR) repeat protein
MIDIILLQTLGLKRDASVSDVREIYLQLTGQIKFRKILLSDERLQTEFTRYHEAYVSLLHQYEEEGCGTDTNYYPPEQVARFLFNSGVYHILKQNFIKAGEKLQQAYSTNGRDSLTIIYLGILLMLRRNFFAAEKYFLDAAKIDPDNEDAWFYAAENYSRAGNDKKALEMYTKVRTLNPLRKEIDAKIRESAKKSGIKVKDPNASGQPLLKKISNLFKG